MYLRSVTDARDVEKFIYLSLHMSSTKDIAAFN